MILDNWNFNQFQANQSLENALSIIGKHKKILIHARPGMGKSTFLMQFSETTQPSHLARLFPYTHFEGLLADLPSSLGNDDWLLLDALEDFAQEAQYANQRHDLIYNFIDACSQAPQPVVLTIRSSMFANYSTLFVEKGFHVIELNPWRQDQIDAFFAINNLPEPNPDIRQLLQTPFYADLYGQLSQELQGSPTNFQLIEAFIDYDVRMICKKYRLNQDTYMDFLFMLIWYMRCFSRFYIPDQELAFRYKQKLKSNSIRLISILKKQQEGYTMSHELFSEYLIAKHILNHFRNKRDFSIFSHFITSYQEDMFIGHEIQHDEALLLELKNLCDQKPDNSVFFLNLVGLLSKVPNYPHKDSLMEVLNTNKMISDLYLNAILSRLLLGSSVADFQWDEQLTPDIIRRLTIEIETGADPVAAFLCLRLLKEEPNFKTLASEAEKRHALPYLDHIR